MDKEKNRLVKRAHTLYGRLGMSVSDRDAFLSGYGVEHTNEMSVEQLLAACQSLERVLKPRISEEDRWRKRVMAAIGGYLSGNREGFSSGGQAAVIKAVACRAAGCTDFNRIPLGTLRAIYYEFRNKQKVRARVEVIDKDRLVRSFNLN